MKVFIGFGYNDNDKWIDQLIIPLVEALGCEVLTGEEMQGERLSDGVIERISDSDACIGFLTKRGKEANQNGTFPTHRWVIEELTTALNKGKPIFEIREKGVDAQNGIIGDRQRLDFEDIPKVLLEVAKFVMKEKNKLSTKIFMLLPQEILTEIRPHLVNGDITCSYRFMYKTKYYDPEVANLERFQGGYGVIIKKIPNEDALIEIKIKGPNRLSWSSGFVSVGLINVHIQKD
jgi:hypothetical protein